MFTYNLEKIDLKELVNKVLSLKKGEILNFFNGDEFDINAGSYAIQKINWLDSDLILIGGYEGDTRSLFTSWFANDEMFEIVYHFIDNYIDDIGGEIHIVTN